MNNGKTKWLLWLAGIVAFTLTSIIAFMGNCMYANDVKNYEERTRIEYNARVGRERISDKVDRHYSDIIQRLSRIEAKIENK